MEFKPHFVDELPKRTRKGKVNGHLDETMLKTLEVLKSQPGKFAHLNVKQTATAINYYRQLIGHGCEVQTRQDGSVVTKLLRGKNVGQEVEKATYSVYARYKDTVSEDN